MTETLEFYFVTQVPSWLLGHQRGSRPHLAFKELAVWGRQPDEYKQCLGCCDGRSYSWELEDGGAFTANGWLHGEVDLCGHLRNEGRRDTGRCCAEAGTHDNTGSVCKQHTDKTRFKF